MKLINRLLQRLYMLLCRHRLLVRPGVKLDLERLHPEANQEALCRDYYVEKLEKSLLIFGAGTILAVFLALRAAGERKLEQGVVLKRGDVLDEGRTVTVETLIEGSREQFQIRLEPRQLNAEEEALCYQEFSRELPRLIAGGNPSLQEVTQDLKLQESYEGYPFSVEWRSMDVDVVTSGGAVRQSAEETQVELKASIGYGGQEWTRNLTVRVPAEELTPAQKRHRALAEQLAVTEEESRMEECWTLPEMLDGAALQWRMAVEDHSLLLWAGALAVSVLIYILGDRDLHEKLGKRREAMKRDYPDIVHKLALYLGAGMTLRGAFEKIASEYERRRDAGIPMNPAYEEMLYTCRELRSGVSEGRAYEHFGKRTGLQEYIRLSTLLAQNLQKGSSSLLSRLHEEADNSLSEQIRMGRKLGEEASTKLLAPMVMMLAVVMVMVILPAFGSLGL